LTITGKNYGNERRRCHCYYGNGVVAEETKLTDVQKRS